MTNAGHYGRAVSCKADVCDKANDARKRLAAVNLKYNLRRKKLPRPSMASLRLRELHRLFAARYGPTLPDDDAGRDDIEIVAHHLAWLPGNTRTRIDSWIALYAPWMGIDERGMLIDRVTTGRKRWSADELARLLGLTMKERTKLAIRTIGAIDMSKRERIKLRKERNRFATNARRRAQGVRTRKEYLANAASRLEPWKAEGMSERTWYRRQTAEKATHEPKLAEVCVQ